MADAAGHEPDERLAGARVGEVDLGHVQRLAELLEDGGADLHGAGSSPTGSGSLRHRKSDGPTRPSPRRRYVGPVSGTSDAGPTPPDPDQTSQLQLLVDSVTDYAIFLLRTRRHDRHLEPRRADPQGLRGRGDHRPALLGLLHRRRSRAGASRGGAADRRARGPLRGGGLARAQGRHALLGPRRHHRAQAGRRARRVRQGHPGPDRPPSRRAGAARTDPRAGARQPGPLPLPPAGLGRDRLRDLPARARRDGGDVERRRGAHQGLRRGRDRRPALLDLLHRRRSRARAPGGRAADRRARGPLRGGGLARAQGRHAVLGQCA